MLLTKLWFYNKHIIILPLYICTTVPTLILGVDSELYTRIYIMHILLYFFNHVWCMGAPLNVSFCFLFL